MRNKESGRDCTERTRESQKERARGSDKGRGGMKIKQSVRRGERMRERWRERSRERERAASLQVRNAVVIKPGSACSGKP